MTNTMTADPGQSLRTYGPEMEFLVLGPVAHHADDVVVSLGGPKQRAVLGMLIATSGNIVSVDALIGGVWGPDASPSLRSEDIVSGVDPEVLHARYGLNPNASVSGLGDLVGYDCMAGSDSGLEAITVRRRAGQDVYLDYIIADGGAAFDWADWFAATRPEMEMRPFEYGWTSEPKGLSRALPDQPVWESLASVVDE